MENRHFTRVDYTVGASISYCNEVVICTTNNLSLHGMYLMTGSEIPLNIPVNVTIYQSNQESLKVNARVIRKEDNGVGLQINDLNVNSFVQLRNIVSENINDSGTVLQETLKMLKCIK